MSIPVIGFIGFGEAAYLISQGLKSEGAEEIYAFDVNSNDLKLGPAIQQRVKELKIGLKVSLEELLNNCDVIICATSAKVAEVIAEDIKRVIKPEQLYIDINATSPMVKERIAAYMAEAGAKFVDGAVMESVPLNKHKVPIFISGSGAQEFQKMGTELGMNLTMINEKAGSSSAIKMFRSVFMKGFTMLLLETLHSSDKYGVSGIVMNSLEKSISNKELEEVANTLINRTAIHAERRVAEMDEVIKTLEHLEVNSLISQSVKTKLSKLVDLNIREKLNNEVPDHYIKVLRKLQSFD